MHYSTCVGIKFNEMCVCVSLRCARRNVFKLITVATPVSVFFLIPYQKAMCPAGRVHTPHISRVRQVSHVSNAI